MTDPARSKLPHRTTRGRPPTGSLRWTKDKGGSWRWHARISLADGSRPLVPLDPDILHEDQDGAAACAAKTSAYFRENGMAPDTTQETVAEYATRWLADREGRVNSIRDDRGRMNHHVLPVLGPLDAGRFDRDDVERLRDALDKKIADGTLSWKTAANCWTVVTSMCSDMVSSKRRNLRVREDNATDKVRAPERGGDKAKQYLYPSEFLTFVSCEKARRKPKRPCPIKAPRSAARGPHNAHRTPNPVPSGWNADHVGWTSARRTSSTRSIRRWRRSATGSRRARGRHCTVDTSS